MITTGPILPVRKHKSLITVNTSPSLQYNLPFGNKTMLSHIGEKGQLDILELSF